MARADGGSSFPKHPQLTMMSLESAQVRTAMNRRARENITAAPMRWTRGSTTSTPARISVQARASANTPIQDAGRIVKGMRASANSSLARALIAPENKNVAPRPSRTSNAHHPEIF